MIFHRFLGFRHVAFLIHVNQILDFLLFGYVFGRFWRVFLDVFFEVFFGTCLEVFGRLSRGFQKVLGKVFRGQQTYKKSI